MKAMLFSAGLGTRLSPLTDTRPKALVELNGRSLLQIAVEKMLHFGFENIAVNVHHFPDLMLETIEKNKGWGANIHISDEREALLETGGGLKKAESFFDDAPFLVQNVDVVHDLDLRAFYDYHCGSDALATLAIRRRLSSRSLLFDAEKRLCGWQNTKTGELKMSRTVEKTQSYGFSGLHVISPELLQKLPAVGKFSIIDPYLSLAQNHLIQGFDHTDGIWFDVGTVEKLNAAAKFF
jgi:N-acetyl-alpha-D-muramate 1-phosphate uridylyltransferase